jgi:hypothetical protein
VMQQLGLSPAKVTNGAADTAGDPPRTSS